MLTSGPLSSDREFVIRIVAVEWTEGQSHEKAASALIDYLQHQLETDYFFVEEVLETHGLIYDEDTDELRRENE